MDSKNKISNQDNQSKKDQAINKKGTPDDAREINHQVMDKREQHQPRDNA